MHAMLHCKKIFFKVVDKTKIIGVLQKYYFSLSISNFIFNSVCYVPFLCNYLWNLLAIAEWKLFKSKFYTLFFYTLSFPWFLSLVKYYAVLLWSLLLMRPPLSSSCVCWCSMRPIGLKASPPFPTSPSLTTRSRSSESRPHNSPGQKYWSWSG